MFTAWTTYGIADMVAVRRFAAGEGNPVDLTEAERRVAVHVMADAGYSIRQIARRLRTNDVRVSEELERPAPVERRRHAWPLTLAEIPDPAIVTTLPLVPKRKTA